MPRSLPAVIALIAILAVVSTIFSYVRYQVLTTTDQLESKTAAAARRDTAVFFGGVAVVVGVIAVFVFRAMAHASPDTAQHQFMLIALGIGVVLEVMAASVFKMRGIAEFTVLHVLHFVAYGWLLPLLLPI